LALPVSPVATIDETTLSLDLGARSFADFFAPLASLQTGPVLFLWGVKLCTTVGGMSEYTLRLLPLAAGLLVPYLVWRVARRLLTENAAILATALAAVAPSLIQYSVTVKPYITDALIALLLVHYTLDVLERPDARGPWLRLGVVGLAAVLGSIPAPFLLAGVTAAVLLGARPLKGRVGWRLAACLAVWGSAFLPIYAHLYRPVAASEYMQQFWGPSFFAPDHPAGWWNLGRALVLSLIGRPAPAAVIYPVDAYLAAGLWMLVRSLPRATAALVGVPLLTLLIASAADRYPLAARVLIFAVPTFIISLAAVSTHRSRIGWMLGGLAVLGLVGVNLTHPYRPAATRQAVDSIVNLAAPGEAIYIASGGIPAWAFYTTDWSAPDTGYLGWVGRWAGRPGAAAFHNTAPRGRAVAPREGDDLSIQRVAGWSCWGWRPESNGRKAGVWQPSDPRLRMGITRGCAHPGPRRRPRGCSWRARIPPRSASCTPSWNGRVECARRSPRWAVRLARFRFRAAVASAPAAARPSCRCLPR
jgi:hypothetical protein